jgi:putative hydrolase of the HAD superfamily
VTDPQPLPTPEITKPPIKAVIFDYGGVLMRTTRPASGRREWEQRLGLPEGELERIVHKSDLWLKAQVGEVSYDDYWKGIGARLKIAPEQIPLLRHDYFRDDHLDQDLIALIRSLRARGLLVGLLSNDTLMLEQKLREELKIFDEFSAVMISARMGVMKPDVAIYQAMLAMFNLRPVHAVFIDDSIQNVAAAHYLGMAGIWFSPGINLRQELDVILSGD